jgi:hypothetical protein
MTKFHFTNVCVLSVERCRKRLQRHSKRYGRSRIRKSRGRSVSLHPHCRSRCPFRLFVRCVLLYRRERLERERELGSFSSSHPSPGHLGLLFLSLISVRSTFSRKSTFRWIQPDIFLLSLSLSLSVCVRTFRMKQERKKGIQDMGSKATVIGP